MASHRLSESGPPKLLWSGPCVARRFPSNWRRRLHNVIPPLEWDVVVLPGPIMDISARAVLIRDRDPIGPFGSPVFARARKDRSSILSCPLADLGRIKLLIGLRHRLLLISAQFRCSSQGAVSCPGPRTSSSRRRAGRARPGHPSRFGLRVAPALARPGALTGAEARRGIQAGRTPAVVSSSSARRRP